jgi:hypothetical protein
MRFRFITSLCVAACALAAFSAGASATTGRFVALGDSDPAASGLSGADPAANSNCFRTVQGHPRLAAVELGASEYGDATCASATIPDLFATQILGGNPVNPPQVNALNGNESIITLTIGDNDASVTEMWTYCLQSNLYASATPCKDHFGTNGLKTKADAIASPLANAIDTIRSRSPKARIFLVGYPRLLPTNVSSCPGRINVTSADAPMVTAWQQEIENIQKSTAAAKGIDHIDMMAAAAAGTDGCADVSTRWLNPMIGEIGWKIHPTLIGQQAAAAKLIEAIKAANLWTPPPPNTLGVVSGFAKMRAVIGARKVASLTQPKRGGGRVRVISTNERAVTVLMLRKRAGRVIGGKCRLGSTRAGATRCAQYHSWGKPATLTVKAGTTSIWLTGSYAKRAAVHGIYRVRISGQGVPPSESKAFTIAAR